MPRLRRCVASRYLSRWRRPDFVRRTIRRPPWRDRRWRAASLRPGEISLAHHGVLFLDELPEGTAHLEVLREPLESGRIVISAARQAEFPARFQLVAAMILPPWLGRRSVRAP